MSDKPISVGDLVVVVRACCDKYSKYLGYTFQVTEITGLQCRCMYCHSINGSARVEDSSKSFGNAMVKRIPPLSELEGADTQEKIREPA